uniref:proline-rich protein 36 n=1 Tax=Monopterus albus TaxID=43700 RepID=UPI0009B46DF7|nr:proline-rich protein 36-like [Monopterus albus]
MKKGSLNFLGRKNQSLFDTNIKVRDMDNVNWMLDSAAIPESGTASVRARPTVNHHTSTDTFQGFAVPTPKVPLLPPVNGPKANGSVAGNQLLNGSVISVSDPVEGEIFVPPPPSTAPPPPPGTFIIPPPDFMGDLNHLDTMLHPASMPVSKPSSLTPPKLRSTSPELNGFSSISSLDSPPQTPAPPPPVHAPTASSFNPQTTAKLYNVPKTSVLSGYEDRDTRPKQKLLLDESGSVHSPSVLAQVDGNDPTAAALSKPLSKDVKEPKKSLHFTKPSQPPPPVPNMEAKTETVLVQPEIPEPPQTPPQMSAPQLKMNSTPVNLEPRRPKLELSQNQTGKFSPLLDRKLRTLKIGETSGPRDGHAASPLALLKAAKEREKHKSTQSLSRENSAKQSEQPSANIHLSDSSPNSFVVIPKSSSSSSLALQERIQESPKSAIPVEHTQTIQFPKKSSSPAFNMITTPASPSAINLAEQRLNVEQSPSKSQPEFNQGGVSLPVLPPPPEFDDFEELMKSPPSIRPPNPPVLKPTAPTVNLPPAALVPSPPPPPKPKAPAAPKPPPLPEIDIKPKPQGQAKRQAAPTQLPSNLSPNQTTLLSILQKKMLEMDHKMAPAKEAESSSDDWSSPMSDEENKVPVVPRPPLQSKKNPVVNKPATLDMRELEGKVVKKYQEASSVKSPTSNGPSKYTHGKTFMVRPGAKDPITLVSREY